MEANEYLSETEAIYEKWRAEVEAQGEARGEARGRAEALIAVLHARGFELSDAQAARIRGCTNVEQIAAWIRRAVTAQTVDEALM